MRRITVALALLASLYAPQAIAGTDAPTRTERVESILIDGQLLRAIDAAFYEGALTFPEARALYAEHAAVRADYIRNRVLRGDEAALQRAEFMIRVAQSTLARLTYNAARRVEVQIRLAGR